MPSKTSQESSPSSPTPTLELPGDSKHLRVAKERLDEALAKLAVDVAEGYVAYQAATTLPEMREAIGPLITTLTSGSRSIPPLHITFEREIRVVEGA